MRGDVGTHGLSTLLQAGHPHQIDAPCKVQILKETHSSDTELHADIFSD